VDLFAWGATMIYAATGRHAFPGDTAQAVMFRVVDSPPQLYDIEEPVRALVARCLAKDPRRRPTAAQAKRLLVGQAPRPRKFTPGVASSGPAGAAKAPAPTKVGPVLAGPGTAGVAAPVVLAPYTLKLNSAAAIWWESGTDKVACFVFGRRAATPTSCGCTSSTTSWWPSL
jgi:hypothetical protein